MFLIAKRYKDGTLDVLDTDDMAVERYQFRDLKNMKVNISGLNTIEGINCMYRREAVRFKLVEFDNVSIWCNLTGSVAIDVSDIKSLYDRSNPVLSFILMCCYIEIHECNMVMLYNGQRLPVRVSNLADFIILCVDSIRRGDYNIGLVVDNAVVFQDLTSFDIDCVKVIYKNAFYFCDDVCVVRVHNKMFKNIQDVAKRVRTNTKYTMLNDKVHVNLASGRKVVNASSCDTLKIDDDSVYVFAGNMKIKNLILDSTGAEIKIESSAQLHVTNFICYNSQLRYTNKLFDKCTPYHLKQYRVCMKCFSAPRFKQLYMSGDSDNLETEVFDVCDDNEVFGLLAYKFNFSFIPAIVNAQCQYLGGQEYRYLKMLSGLKNMEYLSKERRDALDFGRFVRINFDVFKSKYLSSGKFKIENNISFRSLFGQGVECYYTVEYLNEVYESAYAKLEKEYNSCKKVADVCGGRIFGMDDTYMFYTPCNIDGYLFRIVDWDDYQKVQRRLKKLSNFKQKIKDEYGIVLDVDFVEPVTHVCGANYTLSIIDFKGKLNPQYSRSTFYHDIVVKAKKSGLRLSFDGYAWEKVRGR